MNKPPKNRLYELYWGDGENFRQIADRYDIPPKDVGGWFREYGIPYDNNHNRNAFIFAMRDRRYYYELYWGQRLGYTEIANKCGIGTSFVGRKIREANIPTRDDPYPTRKADEIPQRYEWPESEPAVLDTDDPTADLPDNPDGSKYIADTNGEFDKDRLYELYWGYGCSIKQMAAMLEVPSTTLRDRFGDMGIPIRSWNDHLKWEPQHGVPPKYEWHREFEQQDDAVAADDYDGMQWRVPAVSD